MSEENCWGGFLEQSCEMRPAAPEPSLRSTAVRAETLLPSGRGGRATGCRPEPSRVMGRVRLEGTTAGPLAPPPCSSRHRSASGRFQNASAEGGPAAPHGAQAWPGRGSPLQVPTEPGAAAGAGTGAEPARTGHTKQSRATNPDRSGRVQINSVDFTPVKARSAV